MLNFSFHFRLQGITVITLFRRQYISVLSVFHYTVVLYRLLALLATKVVDRGEFFTFMFSQIFTNS